MRLELTMSERKTIGYVDIYEGKHYVLITTTISAGLELVDMVDDYMKQGFTVASTSSGGNNIQVHMVRTEDSEEQV